MPSRILSSPLETARFASLLGRLFKELGPSPKSATVIGFRGDLGAGKTSFIKSFLKAIGVRARIMSPTFVIMKSFPLKGGKRGFTRAYHLDVYRISKSGLKDLDFKKVIAEPRNIVLIEWADKIRSALPRNTVWISLGHGRHAQERFIKIQ